ncbi:MAG: SGNH/GDSL hydrolase family protein [Rudaea sp.]|uniref:SGNH/GDSL hydrolase family protein n=1 Tax=unclassified Rudaea TaxID=2627037 RepID=UPI0010F86CA9|nr:MULTISPECIES: SGNH/GDSL hydrolase family protein [unclassified Rudaea]MBN8885225.1 SGNH/GDSL hydrolase family protein [Rudaea sp.]MBR0345454.1 SGNH/GDSL hydrolase family protein [Rudaea sp.]
MKKAMLFSALALAPSAFVFAQNADTSPTLAILAARLNDDESRLADWPLFSRYREENGRLAAPKPGETRVVFMGDSITDFWGLGDDHGTFFPGKAYVNRGIRGQTTAQMLVRFRADVIALKPKVVVIHAGTNDIAGNTGPATQGMIEDNLASMSELAEANGIKVVIASVLPINTLIDEHAADARPPQRIRDLNAWLRAYAQRKGYVYLDYYAAMVDDKGALKEKLTYDGLHPNTSGYDIMSPLAQRAIEQALAQK